MERRRLSLSDSDRPDRSVSFALDERGILTLRASPGLGRAFDAAVGSATPDLAPIRFDDPVRGLALTASLVKGVPARLLEVEFASGAFEIRAFIRNGWVRMTARPGDFDPDAAWEFIQAVNEAKLESPRT